VFREPQEGQFSTEQVISEGAIAPLAFPDIQVSIENLLEARLNSVKV
jgi:hypothetical protein